MAMLDWLSLAEHALAGLVSHPAPDPRAGGLARLRYRWRVPPGQTWKDLRVPPRREYDPFPCYPPTGGRVGTGWEALAAELALAAGGVLAIDGPAILDWPGIVAALTSRVRPPVDLVAVTDYLAGWDQIRKRTAPVDALRDDPDFATLPSGSLAELLDELPAPTSTTGRLVVVYGPGAELVRHDVLWYADLPKRYAEAAVTAGEARNLGQPADAGPATTRRLFYIDWPLLDRHRDSLAGRIDC